jgi:hypothetical protein
VEPPQGSGDDFAMGGMRIHGCGTKVWEKPSEITLYEGEFGDWA